MAGDQRMTVGESRGTRPKNCHQILKLMQYGDYQTRANAGEGGTTEYWEGMEP